MGLVATHPVVRISFGGGAIQNLGALASALHQQLEQHERQFSLPARYPNNHSRFTDLIIRLHEQTGQRVVVLDEYDKPILDRIEDPAMASAMREELKDIYSVIKDLDAHIRFAFLTGVSKFSKVSLRELFQSFFASIPHHWFDNNPIAKYEGYYASVFYSYFAALGFDVTVEDATNHGRIDMTVKLPGHIYLFEFKVAELVPNGRALQQLKDKRYADKYRADGLPISMIGVEFSRETRNVAGFEAESVV